MLFIDHDQSQIVQRGEKGGTGTNHHLGPAFTDLMPRFPPLRHGLTTMQNAQPDPPTRQTPPEAGHSLRSQGNFGHQNNGVAPLFEHRIQGLQINLRLPTSRDTLQQDGTSTLLLFSLLVPIGQGPNLFLP
jgi:hypothetical protein